MSHICEVSVRENWRWKRKASADQGVAYSEGFRNKIDCINNARSFGYVVDEKAAALSRDPFSDITMYSRLMLEVGQYVEDVAQLSIEKGWMEKPPQAVDRKELALSR